MFVVIVEIQQDVTYFFRSFPLYRQTLFQIGVERGDILKFFGKTGKSVQKSLRKLDECLFYPFVCRTRQFVVYPAMGDVGRYDDDVTFPKVFDEIVRNALSSAFDDESDFQFRMLVIAYRTFVPRCTTAVEE